ncbi:uncharacterized protein LOC134837838 [Culicoides brevitarsis]|uniref:uncharacterized protein LOC134837838 n=1 Tax=Culicoides brevitarsis TaxID=469753 RepID=UPI00307C9F33
MGNLCNKCKEIKRKSNLPIVILGMENAGKTEIAHKLCKIKRSDYLPTSGCKVYDEIHVKKLDVSLTELGGGPNIRGIWKYYLLEAYGVIYVIDSSDISKLEESRTILGELLSNPHLEGKPFLILGNKQDLPAALDYLDIFYYFGLEQMANSSQSPCMLEVTGNFANGHSELDTAMEWLASAIEHRLKAIRNMIKFFQQLEDVKNEIANMRPVTSTIAKIHRKSLKKLKLRPNTAPNVKFKPQIMREMPLLLNLKTQEAITTPPNVVPIEEKEENPIPLPIKSPIKTPEKPQSPQMTETTEIDKVKERDSENNNFVKIPQIEYFSDNLDEQDDDLKLSSMNVTEVQVQVHRVDEKSPYRNNNNELPVLNNVHQKVFPSVPNGNLLQINNEKNRKF